MNFKNKILFFFWGIKDNFSMSKYINLVNNSQYWSTQEIQEYQTKLLIPLIEHAYNHVPFYKNLLDNNNVNPCSIRTISDLSKIPVIRKSDVIKHFDSFIADNMNMYHPVKHHTGGTTGIPFKYYNDRKSWALNWAVKMRTFEWAGYNYGKDRLGVMAGGSLIAKRSMGPKHAFWRWINNYYSMPISHLDNNIMEKYRTDIIKQKINFLRGYPSCLTTFAEYILSINTTLPMKAVFTTAEMLYPHQRRIMERAFGCQIFNSYGCGDGMGQAVECHEHSGFHICPEVSIMQIVDENGNDVQPGQEGEIVLTSLYDYSMPFIRYAPGDRAVLAPDNCKCGRKLPMLANIVGRSSDSFRLSNGRILNGLSFPIEDLSESVKRFQIIQTAPDKVEVLIIPKTTSANSEIDNIKKTVEYHCGEGVEVTTKIVNSIETPTSDKFRYIISRIS